MTRNVVTHNHNLAFSGGGEDTRYRASMNYAKEDGVTLSTGLERIQGRLSATHSDLNNRLRIGVNVTTSRVNNTYVTYENQGGFQGGVFQSMAVINPTEPIMVTDSLGTHYYDPASSSVHNPVAMANQITDIGHSTRTLANASADLDVAPGLTARVVFRAGQRGVQGPFLRDGGSALRRLVQVRDRAQVGGLPRAVRVVASQPGEVPGGRTVLGPAAAGRLGAAGQPGRRSVYLVGHADEWQWCHVPVGRRAAWRGHSEQQWQQGSQVGADRAGECGGRLRPAEQPSLRERRVLRQEHQGPAGDGERTRAGAGSYAAPERG